LSQSTLLIENIAKTYPQISSILLQNITIQQVFPFNTDSSKQQ